MKDLISAISEYQKAHDIDNKALAQKIGVSPSTISRIKTGQRKPGARFLRSLADKIPALKYYVANYVVNGDKPPAKKRRRGRPTWRETLAQEKAQV